MIRTRPRRSWMKPIQSQTCRSSIDGYEPSSGRGTASDVVDTKKRRRCYRSSVRANSTSPGLGVARLVDVAHLAAASANPAALTLADAARIAARKQRAHRSRHVADLLVAFNSSNEDLSKAIVSIGTKFPWHITYLADLMARKTGDLDAPAGEVIQLDDAGAPNSLAACSPAPVRCWAWSLSIEHRQTPGEDRGRNGRKKVAYCESDNEAATGRFRTRPKPCATTGAEG